MPNLTTKSVESLRGSGKRKSEPVPGGGSLVARGLSTKISFTYVYSLNGHRLWYPVGNYSRDGNSRGSADTTSYTLTGARKRVQNMAALVDRVGDIRSHLEAERALLERKYRQAEETRLANEQRTAHYSLQALCEAYCDHLDNQGKTSAKDVRNSLTRWITHKQPVLAAIKASEITTQDIRRILKAIIAEGKTTTVNRVRSYLMAAYSYGASSSLNLLADDDTSDFNITINPVAAIPAVKQFEKAGERHLTNEELSVLLRRLIAEATPASKVALLSIRLGAQRIRQLLAATEYDHGQKVLTLYDGKGRRLHARAHRLPVVEQAQKLLIDGLLDKHPIRAGLYGGVGAQTISNLVRSIGEEMANANNSQPFKWQDIRRTAETMLAAMGISKDTRAQLQSHGITGVQAKHYDRHDYMGEKAAALIAWNAKLDDLITGTKLEPKVIALTR